MHSCARNLVILVSTTLGILPLAALAQSTDSWQIESRTVPAPAGASQVLKEHIAKLPLPNTERRLLYRKTRQEWDAAIKEQAKARQIDIPSLEKNAGVSIEESSIAGVPVFTVLPNKPAEVHKDHQLIYLHGGAYVFGSGTAAVGEASIIAAYSGISVVALDYRMPPEHPFPAAIDDVVTVYKALLKKHKPEHMAMGGTSAGGGLTLASVHQFKSLSLPLPGALYAGTPWADLSKTGDTLFTNEGLDNVLATYEGLLKAAAELYANGEDLKNPLLSPVYGDFSNFPPTYLVTGTRDLFLSDTARTHRKLRRAGVIADLNVYEGLSHAEYAILVGSPESVQAYGELADFLIKHLK